MLRVYKIRYKGDEEDRAWVAAETRNRAIYLAQQEDHCKFNHDDWISLRARLDPEMSYLVEDCDPTTWCLDENGQPLEGFNLDNCCDDHEKVTEEKWLFDNETYEDVLAEERRWFDSQCL